MECVVWSHAALLWWRGDDGVTAVVGMREDNVATVVEMRDSSAAVDGVLTK
jgi:hypothetical protein